MSHEVDIHSAQTAILRELLFHPSANFATLQKTTGLDSDHFKFHIKRLLDLGYVEKTANSHYALTIMGKEYSNRLDTDDNTIERQPKVSVALIIENDEGKFLAQQRLKQPYFGFWGRPTGKIRWGETLLEAGERELLEETGLTANLRIAGFYHKMDYEKESTKLLEDKLFCIVYGSDPKGELIIDDEGHHNEWLSVEEIIAKDSVFESVPEITRMGQEAGIQFMEQSYHYEAKDY